MAKKPLSPEARDRAKDKRLQSKYGITLSEQNVLRQRQNNKCKICGAEFNTENPACTDHFHFKVVAIKLSKGSWKAETRLENGCYIASMGCTKVSAVRSVKSQAAAKSVRGLLCRKCNRGLGYIERFFDSARRPETLTPVIEYFSARHENT